MQNRYTIIAIIIASFVSLQPIQSRATEYNINLSAYTQYTDNLYLTEENTEDDWLSLFEILFSAQNSQQKSLLTFSYKFTRAQYWKHSENNTNRQNLFLNYSRNLTRKAGVRLYSTYNFSEEPIERESYVFRERKGKRETYYRITLGGNTFYTFTKTLKMSIGGKINYLQNKNHLIEDARIYSEFWNLTKDFVRYFFTMGIYGTQRDLERTPQVNTVRYNISAGYHITHNKNISLNFSAERTQDSAPGENDYWVYNCQSVYNYQLTKSQQISLGLGYYIQIPDRQQTKQKGITYSINYQKTFKRTSFSINGSGGYRYEYGEAENRGFTKYYLISASSSRKISRKLSASLSGSYRHEKFTYTASGYDTYNLNMRLHKQLLKQISMLAQYSYRRSSPFGKGFEQGYEENVAILSLTYHLWRGHSLW